MVCEQSYPLAASSSASCSPPEATYLQPSGKRRKLDSKMSRVQAHWDPAETAHLLKLALDEKQKLNWNHAGVSKDGWRNIYPQFPQYTHKQVTNKFDYLKQQYIKWKRAQSGSGLGRDKSTGAIAADPEYWQTRYGLFSSPDACTQPQETSHAAADRVHPPPFLTELDALFGDRVTNSGQYISSGGIGSETPPHGMRQPDHSSEYSGSKRPREEPEVQSPQKKLGEVRQYLDKICDSISKRSESKERSMNKEEEETRASMDLLRQDGVPIGSDQYFQALSELTKPAVRHQFLYMDSPEERLGWVDWLMRNRK